MSKQDSHGARTPEDVMRRFRDIPNSLEAAQKAASVANAAAERANAAADQANATLKMVQSILSETETLLAGLQKEVDKKVGKSEYNQIVSMINSATNTITRLVVQSGGLLIDANGNMIVPSIVLNGFDLESRILAIEKKLNNSGGGSENTQLTFDGGTKAVGDEWTLVTSRYTNAFSITAVTGGVEIVTTDDGIGLLAISAGAASATVKSNDGTATNVWNYTIVEADSGGDTSGDESCDHTNTTRTVTKDATCTEPGNILYSCDDCSETWNEAIAALGHKLVMEADDSVSMGASMVCQRCGYNDGECAWDCDILGHRWSYYADSNASSGWSRECTECHEVEEDVSYD